jgi:ABC-type nitrate/sulfonate/bicarbonate transport system substrate-binding protein
MTETTPSSSKSGASTSYKKPGVWLILAAFVAAGTTFLLSRQSAPPLAPVSKVVLALPTQINSAPAIVAIEQGLFKKAGVDVINQPFLLGKDALKSVLDGKADLAIVADTPFMFAVLGGKDIAIIAGISQARRALGIVTRNDLGITSLKNLEGKNIGVTKGTNLPYFLDAMLQVHGMNSASVNKLDLKVDDGVAAFKEGKVDALVLFEPYLAQLEASMGDQIKIFYGEDVYAFRFLLVGKPAYIDGHQEEIQRILKALLAANQSIHADPLAARRAVGEVVKVPDVVMAKLFNSEDYVLSLDQAMLLALDDQSRWAMQQGLVKTVAVPNYLNFIRHKALDAVMPGAVKIVY